MKNLFIILITMLTCSVFATTNSYMYTTTKSYKVSKDTLYKCNITNSTTIDSCTSIDTGSIGQNESGAPSGLYAQNIAVDNARNILYVLSQSNTSTVWVQRCELNATGDISNCFDLYDIPDINIYFTTASISVNPNNGTLYLGYASNSYYGKIDSFTYSDQLSKSTSPITIYSSINTFIDGITFDNNNLYFSNVYYDKSYNQFYQQISKCSISDSSCDATYVISPSKNNSEYGYGEIWYDSITKNIYGINSPDKNGLYTLIVDPITGIYSFKGVTGNPAYSTGISGDSSGQYMYIVYYYSAYSNIRACDMTSSNPPFGNYRENNVTISVSNIAVYTSTNE